MNNKKILALTIALSMAVPTVAFAKEGGNKNNDTNMSSIERQVNNIQNKDKKEADKQAKEDEREAAKKAKETEKQAKEQNREGKKQQKEEFKTQMKAKRDQLASLRKETEGLRSEIGQKKDQLSVILKDIQAGNKTLSQDMLNSLMEIAKTLKVDGEQVRATAKINHEVSDVQGKVKGEDFNNALASMDKVIAKMQARLDALKKLNSDLDEALKIANLAVAPTTDETQGTTETPTTGATDTSDGTTNSDSTETTAPTTTDNTTEVPTTNPGETTTN